MAEEKKRIIVGITGASGVIYGIRLLEILKTLPYETHLIMSRSANLTLAQESNQTLSQVQALADIVHQSNNIAASIASGSFRTAGMIVAPCSIHSMSAIANGITDNLLTRAADVTLKERRPLILMVRETPFHVGHLRTMTQLAEMGAIIAPPVPAFYQRPESIADIVDHSVGRILDLLGIEAGIARRWEGLGNLG